MVFVIAFATEYQPEYHITPTSQLRKGVKPRADETGIKDRYSPP